MRILPPDLAVIRCAATGAAPAREHLRSFCNRRPRRARMWAWLGCCFALALAAAAQTPSLASARKLIANGSYPQAEHLLRSTLVSHPQDADAHLLLGDLLAIEGQRSEAIEELSTAIRLKPNSAVAYSVLGLALSRFFEIDGAQKAFQHALQLDPDLVDAHVNYALLLAQTGDLAAASEQLESALKLQGATPAAAATHVLKAKLDEQMGKPQEAERELQLCVKLTPRDDTAWFMLGKLAQEQLDHTTARIDFEHAANIDPSNASYLYELGSEELALQNASSAIRDLRRAQALNPSDPAILYKLERALRIDHLAEQARAVEAELRAVVGQGDEAAKHSLTAQQLDDEGVALEKQGDILNALAKYQAALELYPEQAGYRLNYGLALCRIHRWSECIAEIREVLRLDPSNAKAQRALFIAEDKVRAAAASHGSPERTAP